MSVFKVFGCVCFASTITNNKNKFNSRSRKCIFLGFKNGIKGYVILDVKTREIFISRDVIFHEGTFIQLENNTDQLIYEENHLCLPFENASNYINETVQPEEDVIQPEDGNCQNTDLRRSARLRKAPEYLQDYHHRISNSVNIDYNKTQVKYPISSVLSYDHLDKKHLCLITSISSHAKPRSYDEAVQKLEWRNAMKVEIDALKLNETWSFTDLPPGKKPIGCKWIQTEIQCKRRN